MEQLIGLIGGTSNPYLAEGEKKYESKSHYSVLPVSTSSSKKVKTTKSLKAPQRLSGGK